MWLCEHIIARAGAEDRRVHLNPVPALQNPREFVKKELFVLNKLFIHAPHNLFSLSGFVLKWVSRRTKEQNLSLKNSLFHCCAFLCCCFKVWAFPAPIHPHSPLLFLVKVCIGTELLDRKMETFYHMPLLNTTNNTLEIFHSTQAA